MKTGQIKYYFLIYVLIIPLSLLSQTHPTDTVPAKIVNDTDSIFIHNQLKSDRFYDSLKVRASKNKITQTALGLILETEPARGKFVGIEDLRNEEYFKLYSGKIIRNIDILRLDVFGPTLADTTTYAQQWIEKIGNKTHVNTRNFIIRNNLFIHSGDTIDPLLLVDNERLLRQLNYIKDASIQIAEIPGLPNYVDILVTTKDVYSAGFYLDLLNTETGTIEIYENNLAGIGHRLQGSLYLSTTENPPTGYKFDYRVNNIGNSFIKARIQYLNAFETENIELEFSRNFVNYNTKWAGSLKLNEISTLTDITKPEEDTTFTDVRLNYVTQDLWIGRAFILKTNSWQFQHRAKFVLGLRYVNNIFYEGPEVSERYNFRYHDNQRLLASAAYSRQRYFKSNLIFGFGKTEDIPVGLLVQVNAGFEADEYYRRPYLGFKATRSAYYPKIGYLNINGEFGSLYYEDKLEQGVIKISGQAISNLHYINRTKFREFLSFNYTRGINRFSDEKIFLNSNDVWGLSSESLFGLQKLAFHSELVSYSDLFIYNFRFLFFAFGDLGLIGPENDAIYRNKLYSGIGLGIRVRNENLVFKTFQIKLAYYPSVPADSEQFYYLISGESYQNPAEFEPTAPGIITFN
jgi:hypothetical protein